MTQQAPDLLELLRRGPASPRDGEERIWDLGPPGLLSTRAQWDVRRVLRSSVLGAMASCGLPVFLRPPDEPPDAELARYLVRREADAWEVAGGRADAAGLHAELSAGGWFLYTAPEPVGGRIPDPFAASAVELVDFMLGGRLAHFVASFHDDVEWVVGLPGPPR